ncbi:hypothetical protein BDD43_3664 [Mucilaginibacter gracilis]|uniref:Uncharacterized protein n=1 Tax=Mucilaginibacter gracilis TaxID=423350 RepID=A0A495J395_9SPHI|nr:hypothetical protein [Mucilaginibacter gracilis]RKR83455.1 hypothetical protein BDD43_3664 [Mucilaginibacter gracilis]
MHVLFLLASLIIKPHLDTVDNWQVYQNKKLLAAYNTTGETIALKRNQIKQGDLITINYFRDTPCSTCSTQLYIEDANNAILKTLKAKGTFTPFKFTLNDILKNTKTSTYLFYRLEDGQNSRKLLFKLMIR